MKAALSARPVGIAVDASNTAFQQYSNGIVDSKKCGTSLDHAVTAVGYGKDNGKEYLLVRNSWGPNWGEQGYIRIALNNDNICGILEQPYYPIV